MLKEIAPADNSVQVAYFSMEIGLVSAMPTYSGGLGVLAGDTLRAAADMGLAVPDDVSIIGYDNLGLGDIMIPRLSTVNQQSSLIGRDMMDRLADRIEKPDLKAEVRGYPQNLVIRESSGPVRRG